MVDLGDKAKDRVTGFEGICVSRTQYISGCTRVMLQPPVDEKGAIPEAQHFDEPMLEVTGLGKVPRGPDDTGGPRPPPQHHRAPVR